MNCNVGNYKTYTVPVIAGGFRFLLGLVLTLVGFYVATLSDMQGHALGLPLVFGAPFIIFKDNK